ncbi:hypothetical protein PoB_006526500 [Plakobranchus ocellatus]|uniref:Uncharacterized protein n=1 Tax=Plakobranchus ocellatus TaxID=259542 RepID=A0AAV4D456_9GAST|nr:hypothetical protein PoB_006526500 [Plakobranchus ocellatus]
MQERQGIKKEDSERQGEAGQQERVQLEAGETGQRQAGETGHRETGETDHKNRTQKRGLNQQEREVYPVFSLLFSLATLLLLLPLHISLLLCYSSTLPCSPAPHLPSDPQSFPTLMFPMPLLLTSNQPSIPFIKPLFPV